jgi:hypothetical protein
LRNHLAFQRVVLQARSADRRVELVWRPEARMPFEDNSGRHWSRGLHADWTAYSNKLKSYLAAITIRQRLARSSDQGEYFLQCCRQVDDAYTIEDAIFWRCELINELSVEIDAVRSSGDDLDTARIVEVLAERQRFLGAAVDRLVGILQRREQLVWDPHHRTWW